MLEGIIAMKKGNVKRIFPAMRLALFNRYVTIPPWRHTAKTSKATTKGQNTTPADTRVQQGIWTGRANPSLSGGMMVPP
jgi:hypothetical protein